MLDSFVTLCTFTCTIFGEKLAGLSAWHESGVANIAPRDSIKLGGVVPMQNTKDYSEDKRSSGREWD